MFGSRKKGSPKSVLSFGRSELIERNILVKQRFFKSLYDELETISHIGRSFTEN